MSWSSIKFLIVSIICLIFSLLVGYFFILPPKVISLTPANGSENVSLDSLLIIKFDKPLKRREIRPLILPKVYGEWKFKDPLIKNHLFRTLVFIPAVNFESERQYQVKLENIKGFGLDKNTSFNFTFKTQPIPLLPGESKKSDVPAVLSSPTSSPPVPVSPKLEISQPKPEIILLEIPLDWQDYPLSCEAASLKMALGYKETYLQEKEIMEKIGYDHMSRRANLWGDPYKAYVGDIDGKICLTGYGVYWQPVAKAANNWRRAESFSNWTIADLTKEISLDNPVIVWGTLPVERLSDCSWYTPEGKYIKAYKETHVRLVIGFIGPQENPSKIILNDPLAGRLFWATDYFLTNWKTFDYSGVVIR